MIVYYVLYFTGVFLVLSRFWQYAITSRPEKMTFLDSVEAFSLVFLWPVFVPVMIYSMIKRIKEKYKNDQFYKS